MKHLQRIARLLAVIGLGIEIVLAFTLSIDFDNIFGYLLILFLMYVDDDNAHFMQQLSKQARLQRGFRKWLFPLLIKLNPYFECAFVIALMGLTYLHIESGQ